MSIFKKLNVSVLKQPAALFVTGLLVGAVIFGALLPAFLSGGNSEGAFQKPYPFPHGYWGENQEYYVFASGGQQGGLYVYSIPAMKMISEIPVFAQDEAWGWTSEVQGINQMLTNPWTEQLASRGDTRDVAPSRTGDVYDGRWIFTADMMHPRVARVDLNTFRTGQVLWLPNVNGGLNSVSVNGSSTALAVTFEHSQYPEAGIREYLGLDADQLTGPYMGGFAGIQIAEDGEMTSAWQIWTPWQQDAVSFGWGASEGWLVTTSYNSERETSTFRMLGNEEDYLFFWNIESIEKAVQEGKYLSTGQDKNVPVVSWEDVEVYAAYAPTNPSGVDISPDGRFMFSGGKAAVNMAVIDIEKVFSAVADKTFEGQDFGIPILANQQIRETSLELGLGPTHAEFDDRGFAYIGSFVDSVVWKVAMGGAYMDQHGEKAWQLVETIPSHFSILHPVIPGGDTAAPDGEYLLVLNKLSKNTFIPHGPLHNENHELYNIGDGKAKLIDQLPAGPESHAARAISVDLIIPNILTGYTAEGEKETPRVEYDYENQVVSVYLDVVRSFFAPDWFSVPQGWTVKMHLYSLEQITDITHGLGIDGYDIAVSLGPGEV
ncbi:MAG: hypothetical protein OEY93_11390, partial [Anaerolineae bacterium]|nr:hypothetical protein [Anaerolineae bacterium]